LKYGDTRLLISRSHPQNLERNLHAGVKAILVNKKSGKAEKWRENPGNNHVNRGNQMRKVEL